MIDDLHAKAKDLLEKIANSCHEQNQKNSFLLCFTSNQVKVVEEWLGELEKPLPEDK